MRARPVDHIARIVHAAIVNATGQGVGDRSRERRSGWYDQHIVATDIPREAEVVVIRRPVVRRALDIVRGAEVLILESARGRAVDVDTAGETVDGGCSITVEAPFRKAVAGIEQERILVADGNAVGKEGAIFETVLEAVGVCVVVGRGGF